jgi:hypothetical protein
MARAKLFPIDVDRPQESATASWDWSTRAVFGRQLRPPKRSPDRRQVLRSGLPPGGLRLRFAPSRDPLKRNSHTLVRLCFIGKDASSKENYCDIFTTINRGSTGTLYSEAIVPI